MRSNSNEFLEQLCHWTLLVELLVELLVTNEPWSCLYRATRCDAEVPKLVPDAVVVLGLCQSAEANDEISVLLSQLLSVLNSSMDQAGRVSDTEPLALSHILMSNSIQQFTTGVSPCSSPFFWLPQSEKKLVFLQFKSIIRSIPSAVFCIHPTLCLGTRDWNNNWGLRGWYLLRTLRQSREKDIRCT